MLVLKPKFQKELLKEISSKYEEKITVVNISTNKRSNIYDSNLTILEDLDRDELLQVFKMHSTYIHTSEFETVGLPIYEAQNLGLKLVIPERPYTNYFRSENVFTYELNNPESALISIEEAKNFNIKNSPALIYNENWSKILEYI